MQTNHIFYRSPVLFPGLSQEKTGKHDERLISFADMEHRRIAQVFIVLFLLAFCRLSAQDGHYWTERYGTRSTILNGVVIGSVDDLGAVYYNPARLGVLEEPGFILSGKVYEWTNIKIEDALDEGLDLKESDFGGVPSLLAGTFRLGFLPRHQFGYAFLTRYRTNVDVGGREERQGDFIPEYPGEELFNGLFGWRYDLKEEWMGLAWAYPLSKKVSVGATAFFVQRKKRAAYDLRLTAVGADNAVAQYNGQRGLSYNANGLLAKIGLAADLAPFTLGVTITTPKWNISGDGRLDYEEVLTGVEESVFVSSYQSGLSARHRWPWSIGAGAGMRAGNNLFHLSGEWFSAVPHYSLMEIDEFVGQTSGDTIRHQIVDELNAVFNFGVGYEYLFNDRYSVHASFATDRTAASSDVNRFMEFGDEISNSISQKDLFHYGAGASLKFKAMEFTVGATYTSSSERIQRPIDFPDEDDTSITDPDAVSAIQIHRWRFVFGFELSFLNRLKEKAGID